MIECYCHFKWTDEVIVKAFEEDELGEFFRCPVDSDDFDGWNSCMGNVNPETGLWQYYQPLKERYDEIIKEREIKLIQRKHKYTINRFL